MPQVNLKDIGQRAGCSVSTVSHILAGRGQRYADETCRQVVEVARQLGYRANQVARGLRSQKTNVIGLVVPEFFFRLDEIEHTAAKHGYRVQMAAHHGDPAATEGVLADFVARQVDGLLVCYPEGDEANLSSIVAGKPTVIVDVAAWTWCDSLVNEIRAAARLATEHLLQLGHRRLVYLGPAATSATARERLIGFEEATRTAVVPLDEQLVLSLPEEKHPCEAAEQVVRAASANWHDKRRPTALVASNCEVAVGALVALGQAGLRVPDEFSIVAAMDQMIGRYSAVPLTSATDHLYQIVADAMQQLLSRLRGDESDRVLRRYAPDLLVRNSSKPYDGRYES